MKRPHLISRGSLTRILKAANEHWERREFDKFFESVERATRLAPADSNILLDLGRAYGKRHLYTQAERCLDQAIRVAPNRSRTFVLAGRKCCDFGNYEMAERYFEQASRQSDASAESFACLAEVYERLRRMEKAATAIDRALHLDPACAPALFVRAKLARHAGHLDQAETLLRSSLLTATKDLQVQIWYELGGVLDRQQRYDEAMAAFLEAKSLLRPDAPRHCAELKVVRTRLQQLKDALSREMVQRWLNCSESLGPLLRLALLGGHPRSGTTLLEQVLDSHDDVVSVEETTIFHDDAYMPLTRSLPDDSPIASVLEAARIETLVASRTNYFHSAELLLGSPLGGRLLIDKNPSLTFLIPALVRVFPEIKILVAIRDPRDVCLSCFMQFMPLSQVSSAYLDLGDTVDEYVALMSMWKTLEPMLAGHYLEVRYEEMVKDLESISRGTLNFLQIPWHSSVLSFHEHARGKLVRSPTYAEVTQPIFNRAVGRWRHYEKYLHPHLSRLEHLVDSLGYG